MHSLHFMIISPLFKPALEAAEHLQTLMNLMRRSTQCDQRLTCTLTEFLASV